MWFLPSRGREKLCQECLDACVVTKMSSPGIVYVDDRVSDYPNLKLPSNWTKVLGSKDLALCKQEFYEQHPDETFYGLLCDDLVPKTEYFDVAFAEAAGDWYMVDCDDDGYLEYGSGLRPMSGGYGWGGKLVRATGWWSLPGIKQAGNDDAWIIFIGKLGLRKYLFDVTIEHKNWRTGKRLQDDTDSWIRDGVDYMKEDFDSFYEKRDGEYLTEIENQIRTAYNADNKDRI